MKTVVDFLFGLLTPTLSAGIALAGQFALSRWNRKAQIRKEWGDRLLKNYEDYFLGVEKIFQTLEQHEESSGLLDLERDIHGCLFHLRSAETLVELYDRSSNRSKKRKAVRAAARAFVTPELDPTLWKEREQAIARARDTLSQDLAGEFGIRQIRRD
ncbi:MAG: hypothetical protein AAFZ38_00385 [Myxococcota bacterium]